MVEKLDRNLCADLDDLNRFRRRPDTSTDNLNREAMTMVVARLIRAFIPSQIA
jgi:hypothetical protein